MDIIKKLDRLKEKYAFIDDSKYLSGLDKLIKQEADTLEQEGYFEEKGEFWSYFETRDYMILLYEKLMYFKETARYRQAVKLAEEMLELSEGDNLGVRFHLFGLYAYFEDDKILELHKKFNNMLCEIFPVAIYYYKTGNNKKYNSMMKKIKNQFPTISNDITEIISNYEDYVGQPAFSIGDFTEVVEFVTTNYYLLLTLGYFLHSIE